MTLASVDKERNTSSFSGKLQTEQMIIMSKKPWKTTTVHSFTGADVTDSTGCADPALLPPSIVNNHWNIHSAQHATQTEAACTVQKYIYQRIAINKAYYNGLAQCTLWPAWTPEFKSQTCQIICVKVNSVHALKFTFWTWTGNRVWVWTVLYNLWSLATFWNSDI